MATEGRLLIARSEVTEPEISDIPFSNNATVGLITDSQWLNGTNGFNGILLNLPNRNFVNQSPLKGQSLNLSNSQEISFTIPKYINLEYNLIIPVYSSNGASNFTVSLQDQQILSSRSIGTDGGYIVIRFTVSANYTVNETYYTLGFSSYTYLSQSSTTYSIPELSQSNWTIKLTAIGTTYIGKPIISRGINWIEVDPIWLTGKSYQSYVYYNTLTGIIEDKEYTTNLEPLGHNSYYINWRGESFSLFDELELASKARMGIPLPLLDDNSDSLYQIRGFNGYPTFARLPSKIESISELTSTDITNHYIIGNSDRIPLLGYGATIGNQFSYTIDDPGVYTILINNDTDPGAVMVSDGTERFTIIPSYIKAKSIVILLQGAGAAGWGRRTWDTSKVTGGSSGAIIIAYVKLYDDNGVFHQPTLTIGAGGKGSVGGGGGGESTSLVSDLYTLSAGGGSPPVGTGISIGGTRSYFGEDSRMYAVLFENDGLDAQEGKQGDGIGNYTAYIDDDISYFKSYPLGGFIGGGNDGASGNLGGGAASFLAEGGYASRNHEERPGDGHKGSGGGSQGGQAFQGGGTGGAGGDGLAIIMY